MSTSDEPDPSLVSRVTDLERIDRALGEGVRKALRQHQRLSHSVAGWKEGRVQWIEPGELERILEKPARRTLPPVVIARFVEDVRFFANAGKDEREQWILERWMSLRNVKDRPVRGGNPPDFIVNGDEIEIVEVQRPGRRRHDEVRNYAKTAASGVAPEPLMGLALADARSHGPTWLLNAVRAKSAHYDPAGACDWILLVYANFSWSRWVDYALLRARLVADPPIFRRVEVLTADGSAAHVVFAR